MSRNYVAMSTALSTVILLSGCSLFGPEEASSPQQIDPPQMSQSKPLGPSKEVTIEVTPEEGAEKEMVAVEQSVTRPVYAIDPDGYVVPLSLSLPKSKEPATQMLSYMVKGGPVESMLPEGFSAVFPEGTKILGMTIKEGVATVDFSPEFGKYDPKEERKIVDALTFALTSFNTIKEVNVWINGYPQDVMPVNGTPITSLSRENGINLELTNNVTMGETTPVTLYFQGESADSTNYYVPVTRLIPRSENPALATVEELIKGPKQGTNLFPVMLPTTKILGVQVENGVAVVNFDDKLLSFNDGKANPAALESVLLSLTENTGAGKVQFMVNGKANVTTGDKDFSKPVSRPDYVNPSKL